MSMLPVIKKLNVTRAYKRSRIPQRSVRLIIEAGRWSLSVHGYQPWGFVVIRNKGAIARLSHIVENKADSLFAGINLIVRATSQTMSNADVLIAVYNDGRIARYGKRLTRSYVHYAKIVEVQAIGAAIQNMVLEADALGLGVGWLCAPLFCERQINRLLGEERELIAMLSLGYPLRPSGSRGKRKKYSDVVRYIP